MKNPDVPLRLQATNRVDGIKRRIDLDGLAPRDVAAVIDLIDVFTGDELWVDGWTSDELEALRRVRDKMMAGVSYVMGWE